jgi:hypothetical protein
MTGLVEAAREVTEQGSFAYVERADRDARAGEVHEGLVQLDGGSVMSAICLAQLENPVLPVALRVEPRETPRGTRRIVPAPRDPRRVVQQP